MQIRVLIADDHPPFLRTLRQILGAQSDLRIVAECVNGAEALAQSCAQVPEVAVLDIEMPQMDGIAVARALERRATRVVLVTMHRDIGLLRRAREAGAFGYVLKENAATEVVPAVRAAAAGTLFAGELCSAFHDQGPIQ